MSEPTSTAAAPVRGDLPAPHRMLTGRTVYRVVWQLNTDVLVGYCWCGTAHEAVDPIELWEWLLAHPDTHPHEGDGPDGPDGPAPSAPPVEHTAQDREQHRDQEVVTA